LKEKVAALVQKTEINAIGVRHTDPVTPLPLYLQKVAQTSPTNSGLSVSIVRWWTKVRELLLLLLSSLLFKFLWIDADDIRFFIVLDSCD
jgi:hypothetical protein